jgi:acetolactate decarboxylase
MNYKELEQYLNGLLPNKKIFYAIKISGDFNYIKARSCPKQSKPYPPIAEVLKQQKVFESRDVPGVMVGFYVPDLGEVNPPGYHFHFLSGDRKGGGHLMDCEIKKVKIEIDSISNFSMLLSEY